MTGTTGETSKIQEVADTANKLAGTEKTTVTLASGDVVDIHKCRARNVGTVLELALFIMKEMNIKTLGELPDIDVKNPAVFLQLIANASDEIFLVAAELCSLDYEDILDLELDDALVVLAQVVNVNKTFFLQKVMPLLGQLGLPKSPAAKRPARKRK